MTAPCISCGTPTSHIVELTGMADAERFMCDACSDKAIDEICELRRQFDELISAGVPRDVANQTMIARIDRMEVS